MKKDNFKKKIKDFVKKSNTLYTTVFVFWSFWSIIRAKFIFRKIKHPQTKKNLKVVFLAVRTIPTTSLVYFDAVFGHALRELGCEVKMLYCDGVLDSCDANTIFRDQRSQCFLCNNFGPLLKDSLNLDCISYRQHISESDIQEIKEKVSKIKTEDLLDYEYLGVSVGRHAQASAIRYFLFGKIDLKNPEEVSVLREKLFYAVIATKVASNVYKEEKPDRIFMMHGMFSTWGPFLEYFRLKDIEVIVYEDLLPRLGCFSFSRNIKGNKPFPKKAWLSFSRSPLKKEEEKQIDAYLDRRFKGGVGDQEMFEKNFNIEIEKKLLLESLSKNKYSKRYIMFPNLAWDVVMEGKISEIFDDVFSWIDTTVEFFKQKKEYQLIIKPHPAELVFEGSRKSIRDYIYEKHSPLPENIVVLNPDIPLRAYDLIGPNSIGLTFNGTIGLELATLGVPVLVVAHIHYQEVGIVKKVETMKEYLRLLKDPKELFSFAKKNIELAKKFAYFYFFKTMVRVPFYRDDKWATIDWKVLVDTKKLLSDKSNVIKICKKIINKEDIVNPL